MLAMTLVRGHAGVEHFDSRHAVKPRVAGMVHLAHAAAPRRRTTSYGQLHSINGRCGVGRSLALAGCDADVNHDAAISGLGSAVKLRRRTTRRRCDSWSGAAAAIAQRT